MSSFVIILCKSCIILHLWQQFVFTCIRTNMAHEYQWRRWRLIQYFYSTVISRACTNDRYKLELRTGLKPMDSFGKWWKWKLIYFSVNAEFYRVVWTIINALLTVRSEMLPFSENNQNIKMFGVPPKTLPQVTCTYIMIICHWAILHYNMSLKKLQEGLMVFFNDSLHFLKIKKKIVEFTKTILWL